MSIKTAGILIISDAILKNPKQNNASEYLIQQLNRLEFDIGKLAIIQKQQHAVSLELESMIKHWDIVIVVEETQDAVIFKSLSTLLCQELHHNLQLIENLEKLDLHHGNNEVKVPSSAKILTGTAYPIVYLQQLYILNEQNLEESFTEILKPRLIQLKQQIMYKKILKINTNTANGLLNDLDNLANNEVQIELKQKTDNYIEFTTSALNIAKINEFELKSRNIFKQNQIESIDDLSIWQNILSSQDTLIKKAIDDIDQCLNQYGPENVIVSFNGGKDCTVLLHLILLVIRSRYSNFKQSLLCLYVQSEHPFPEQDDFIKQCEIYFNLNVRTIQSGIKEALTETLSKNTNYKACFLGTRRTDPYSKDLQVFQMTDSNWPQVMRVNPLLDWHYTDIWEYLLYYKVPYCKLYDLGFTSLGNTLNTTKNASLLNDETKAYLAAYQTYLPAYKLLKESDERNGRNSGS